MPARLSATSRARSLTKPRAKQLNREDAGRINERGGSRLRGTEGSSPTKTPLFRPEELLVDGIPSRSPARCPAALLGPTRSQGRKDGTAERRLRRSYRPQRTRQARHVRRADVRAQPTRQRARGRRDLRSQRRTGAANALVFDVSTLAAIERARASSELFSEALSDLESRGLSIQAPGFDILTLNPQRPRTSTGSSS